MGACLAKKDAHSADEVVAPADPDPAVPAEAAAPPPAPAAATPSAEGVAAGSRPQQQQKAPGNEPGAGADLMHKVKAALQDLSALPADGTHTSCVAAAGVLQQHAGADAASLAVHSSSSPGVCVLVAAVGAGAELLQQEPVMRGSSWSAVACIDKAQHGRPLYATCSMSQQQQQQQPRCSTSKLQYKDWELLQSRAGLLSFLVLPLAGPGGRLLGVVNLASSRPAAFQEAGLEPFLSCVVSGLAPLLSHPLLTGLCDLLASLPSPQQADEAGSDVKGAVAGLLQGVQRLLLATTNITYGARLGLLDGRSGAVLLSLARTRQQESAAGRPAAAGGVSLHTTLVPSEGTILLEGLRARGPRLVADTTQHLQTHRAALDLFVEQAEVVSALVLVPFREPLPGPHQAALYITADSTTNFAAAKPAIISIASLLQRVLPPLLCRSDVVARLKAGAAKPEASVIAANGPAADSYASRGRQQHQGPPAAGPVTGNMLSLLQDQVRDTASRAAGPSSGEASAAGGGESGQLDDLQLTKVIGHGGFATVFSGTWKGAQAAIKVMYTPQTQRSAMKSALEMAVMESLRHPHCVQVFAVLPDMIEETVLSAEPRSTAADGAAGPRPPAAQQGTTNPALLRYRPLRPSDPAAAVTANLVVMELCDRGTLRTAIRQRLFHTAAAADGQQPQARLDVLLKVLLEVSRSLEYIHSLGLIHCDLKPENVMLRTSTDSSLGFVCKLTDFGLVKMLGGDRQYMRNKSSSGTITHLAPERFKGGTKVTTAIDVYAFGMMMFELWTRQIPFPRAHHANIMAMVTAGQRPQFLPDTPPTYRQLAEACWSADAEQRPTASEVVRRLLDMQSQPSGASNPPAVADTS